MSRAIDERIVEMRFDNKQFENGVKESLSSLQKLESALNHNISSDSIDNISRSASKVDLSGLIKSVESISDRFSTFGIVGMRVIENLVDGLMNGLGKAINSVVGQITSGGLQRAMNIENAHFQLQGIINDETKVQQIMKQANESVDGTAYGYDVAAKAASMFAASGVESGKQMENALSGIAGVAATTSTDYEGISRIFTTVAGNGRLMGDELLQLSNRGLNAAATLANFFNGVRNGSVTATEGVTNAIKSLTGAQTAMQSSIANTGKVLEQQYDALSKQYDKEYNLRKKNLDNGYKELQKTLNAEYNTKKSTYDKEYKALSDSLEAEIKAQQKSNSERLKEANKAYQEDVTNYRKATEEKIALIDEEYNESLKLIDEEAYEETKRIDDQIQAIEDETEAEEKAKKKAERATKLAELQKAISAAETIEARKTAEEALAAYQKKIAEEDVAENRKAQIAKLKEQKAAIKEEAALRKQEAKEKRDDAVKSVQEESTATLDAMSEKHDAEIEAMQEAQAAQIEQMQESKAERLSALKDIQNAELERLKEGQNQQLETYKESQDAQLSALKESQQERLKALKESISEQKKAVSSFATDAAITEADIRDMVSKGLISFDMFSEAMATTFGEHAKDANKTFLGSLANIKAALSRTGAMFYQPLIAQNSEFVRLFNAVREKINEFNTALGASNGLAKKFTDTALKLAGKLADIIENFTIANVLVKDYGNDVKEAFDLSTMSLKSMGDSAKDIVSEKIYTPFNALVDVVYTVINVCKGLYSVLKPIGSAFHDVFLATASADGFYKFIERVRELSENLSLSDKNSQNLKKAFTGLFSIIKSVVNVFVRLVKAISGNKDETVSFGDSILSLAGFLGDALTKLSDWIDTSPIVQTAISGLATAFSAIISTVSGVLDIISNEKPWENFISKLEILSGIDLTEIANSIESFLKSIFHLEDNEDSEDIGDNIVAGIIRGIQNGISNLITAAGELADTILRTIKDWLGIQSPSKEGESIGEYFIEGIVNGLKAGFDKIKTKASELASSLLGGTTDGFSGFQDILSGIISLIGGGSLIFLLVKLGKGFAQVSGALAGLFGKAGGLMDSAISALDSVKDVTTSYAKDLRADAFMKTAIGVSIGIAVITGALIALSKQDPDTLLAAAGSLALVAYIFGGVVEKLMWVSSQTTTVSSALNKAAKGLSSSLKNLGKAVKIKAIGSAVKDFAIAVGIIIIDIAGIMYLYNKDKEGFLNAVSIVGIIFGTLVLLAAILSAAGEKFSNGMSAFAKVGVGVLALSLAVLVAVNAIKKILELDFNWERDFGKVTLLASLFGMVSLLALAVGAASRIAGSGGLKTGPLLAMCAMIATTVWSLKSVMDMQLRNDWPVRLIILGGLFAALGSLMLMIGAAAKIAGGKIKATGTILAMCAFIATAVAAISILSVFPADKLKKGALALGSILLILATVLLAASKMANASAGAVVLGMAVIIATIVAALAFLSFIDWAKMIPGAFSLGVVLLAIAVVFNAVAKITDENIWKTVAAMVGMVAVVVGGLFALSKVESWENLLAAALAMSAVLLAVVKAFNVINSSEAADMDHVMEFLLGILAVAAIAQILRTMGDLDWETLLASGAAISAVLLSIVGAFRIINSSEEIGLDKITAFIIGAIAAGIIGLILNFMSGTPWDTLLGMAASISLVLVAIGASFVIINSVKIDLNSIGLFLAGALGVLGIGIALNMAASQPWESLLAAGVAISVVILAMSVAMLLCTAAGALAEPALIGIGLLDVFIANLIVVLSALGGLSRIPGFNDLLDDGGGLLSKLGKTLGNFVGSIVEGISEGVGRALENIGTSLSNFMTNAQPFFDGLSGINQDTAKAAGALAGVVIALAVSEFLNGVTNLLSIFNGSNDMPTFGQKLVSFGESIKEFGEKTAGIDANNIKTVADAALTLIKMAEQIPNTGGLLAKVVGDNDIAEFGRSLAAFAPSLKKFADEVASIKDTSNWKNIADGTLALIDMADQIPNSGGWLAKVVGDNDIGEFGKSLANFAKQIKPFHNNVMGITDVSSWKNVATGTQYLVDMAQSIPNEGGAISLFTGDNGIAEFGKSVLKFGIYISEFDKYVKNIPLTTFTNISTGMSHLISMCKSLKEIDPDVMVTFSNNMAKMAKEGLTSFISTFQSETVVAINTVRSTILQIKNIAQNDTSVQIAFYNLAKRNMTQYMKSITDQTRSLLTTLTTLLNSITKTIQSKDNEYKTLGTNHAKLYTDAVNSFVSKAKTVGENIGKSTVSGIASVANSLKDTSEKLAQVFTTNFERAGKGPARDAAMELTNAAVRVFNDRNDTFKECGENAGEGFARGMRRKVDDVADIARDMAWEARRAIEDELGIYSPSRVLREDGQYTGEGFALGILDRIREVKRAALTLGGSSIDGFEDAISTVRDITEDLDPVITPIVDLTDVMEAADTINDLFSKAISTVSGNVGEASNSMTRRQSTNNQQNIQNGNSNDGPNVTFIQNNNSPKALSRLDIYRDTRNQLMQFREVTNRL